MPSISSHINRKNAFVFSLMLSVFMMPFPFVLQNVIFFLTGLLWLIQGQDYFAATRYNVSWVLWMFFLIHVVSVFNSSNTHEAWLSMERRLPFVLIPLFVFHPVVKDYLPHLKRAFVLGVVCAILILVGAACWRFYHTADTNVFFYHTFARPIRMHAVYLAAYSLFGFVLLNMSDTHLFKSKWMWIFQVVLGLGLILLNSKLMLVLAFVFAGVLILAKQGKSLKKVVILIVSLGVVLLMLSFISPVRERFLKEFTSNLSVSKQEQFRYDTPFSGTSLRLVIWKQCLQILQTKQAWLFGVGTGDAQDLLNQSYIQKGMYTGNPQLHDTGYLGYGPHSSYMETLLSLGLIGVTLLFAMLLILYKELHHHLSGILFLTIICSFFLTESVISTNKGIVFFVMVSCLLTQECRYLKNSVVNNRKNM